MSIQIPSAAPSEAMGCLLALDSAAGACSVALRRSGETVALACEARRHGHAEILMTLIDRVLDQGDSAYDQLTAVAVTVGPGAFTGLRIGLAAARGLGLALGIPVLGLSTLEVMAHAAGPGRPLLLALDSRRGDWFAQRADGRGRMIGQPDILGLDGLAAYCGDLGSFGVAGDSTDQLVDHLTAAGLSAEPVDGVDGPRADHLAALTESRAEIGFLPPEPLYLRPPEVKIQAHGGRLRP